MPRTLPILSQYPQKAVRGVEPWAAERTERAGGCQGGSRQIKIFTPDSDIQLTD